ncbi:unnamed protein product [Rotaria magnacalcarata]|uniref:Uncharacterized protein n=1 Tax=Rotaria magnacalcarata TaxID=392030 RepID=A0A816P5J9_9BILA|nr:unnamed protein product [Rotaria magnacalcarata]CAF2044316.1 unnamed protein product [Rotaria magnacalcarata]CAF2155290.1 unnamed protein product [Rotaria magnacalcarata]CAF3931807.1 unnamed protein product [Rotaria magnacalcarata]CAF4238257.1 unnamed protein product [Rotaria magnacalcarata]
MMLANFVTQPKLMSTINSVERTLAIDDNSSSIAPIKISLVSFEPILATSPNFILVNEFTKRRNQFIVYDENLHKLATRSLLRTRVLDALWYDHQQHFLILTSENVYTIDPHTGDINVLPKLIPMENKTFKTFTLLNQSTLLIAYNEWGAEYIDRWQQNVDDGIWILIERQPLKLTSNEFIGDISTIIDTDCESLAITIYNILTEQWRIEIRNIDTFICTRAILLPGSSLMHDYRLISVKTTESDIKWLAFSPINSKIIAIDSNWKIAQVNYNHPVQRMALFKDNYLIVRITERIDIHRFL